MSLGQPNNSEDDILRCYSVDFVASSPLELAEEAEYVTEVTGTILQHIERDGCLPPESKRVGTIMAYRLDGGRALNDGVDLADVCDAHSQTLADLHGLLFRRTFEFSPVVAKVFPDASTPDVLLIDLVELIPEVRGRGLGLRAARRMMNLFETGDGLVVVLPFPVQSNAGFRKDTAVDRDLSAFTCDDATAKLKLRTYWSRLGFEPVPRTPYMALCPAVVTPTMHDLADDE